MLINFSPDAAPASANPQEDVRGPVTATTVTVSNTSIVALAANSQRAYYLIRNNGSVPVHFTENVVATVTGAFYTLQPGKAWEEGFNGTPRYTGVINAITASGSATIGVNEANLIP
jgi:hypothetical protein